jgi:hypothetical protein
VTAYYKQVSGSSNSATYGGYVFKCTATLPSFTFGVGSARITIPAKYLNYGPVTDGSSTCFGGLQSSSGIGINIFGDVALKAAFVVFDGANTQLGWANKDLGDTTQTAAVAAAQAAQSAATADGSGSRRKVTNAVGGRRGGAGVRGGFTLTGTA